MSGLRVNDSLTIPDAELELRFSTSGGPGGQHANKTSTRVDLTWDVERSEVLDAVQRRRIRRSLGSRIDSSGRLRITSDEHRSQLRNREEARRRLGELVARALRPARPRRPTKPTRAARQRRVQAKRRRGELKRMRRSPDDGPGA